MRWRRFDAADLRLSAALMLPRCRFIYFAVLLMRCHAPHNASALLLPLLKRAMMLMLLLLLPVRDGANAFDEFHCASRFAMPDAVVSPCVYFATLRCRFFFADEQILHFDAQYFTAHIMPPRGAGGNNGRTVAGMH